MTLTEFILARIAEDEAGAQPGTIQNGVFSGIMQYYGMDEADDDDQTAASELCDTIMIYLKPRIVAECEAKRQIVELADYWLHPADPGIEGEDLLTYLALPYAAHPDYQPGWHP